MKKTYVIRTATRATSSSAPASGRRSHQLLAELRERQSGQAGRAASVSWRRPISRRLQATLDQAVGEEQHGGSGRQVHLVIGARRARAEPKQEISGGFQEPHAPVGLR